MFMRHPLTRQQLHYCIFTLKKTINAFDRRYGRKLVFLNDLCFYNYVRTLPLSGHINEQTRRSVWDAFSAKTPRRADDLLDILAPYIPLSLNESTIDLFIRTASDMTDMAGELPDYFTQKALIDFTVTLWRADNPARLEWLLNVCDAVRNMKDKIEKINK